MNRILAEWLLSEAGRRWVVVVTAHTGLGERVVYVAGDRVTGDIMSKPFSMGRNLLCIFSKKHMVNDDSTTKCVFIILRPCRFSCLLFHSTPHPFAPLQTPHAAAVWRFTRFTRHVCGWVWMAEPFRCALACATKKQPDFV